MDDLGLVICPICREWSGYDESFVEDHFFTVYECPKCKSAYMEDETERMSVEMAEKRMKILFLVHGPNKEVLGHKHMLMKQIKMMQVGDRIKFGNGNPHLYDIVSFAVNEGAPEGHIVIGQLPPKFLITLEVPE